MLTLVFQSDVTRGFAEVLDRNGLVWVREKTWQLVPGREAADVDMGEIYSYSREFGYSFLVQHQEKQPEATETPTGKTHPNTKAGWLEWASEGDKEAHADFTLERLFDVWMHQFEGMSKQDLRETLRAVQWEGHILKANGFCDCEPETLAELVVNDWKDEATVEDVLETLGYSE